MVPASSDAPMKHSMPWTGILLFVVVAGASGSPAEQRAGAAQDRQAQARKELAEMYAIWGRARVEVDRPTLEALLAPDFQLLLDGKTSTREQFLDMVTRPGGARLLRFDVEILTLRRTGTTWTAVIAEKLEWQLASADGQPKEICDLWVTRDVCSQEGEEWQFHSSEAIGNENWPPGMKPPVGRW
jgi:hypothetical protein